MQSSALTRHTLTHTHFDRLSSLPNNHTRRLRETCMHHDCLERAWLCMVCTRSPLPCMIHLLRKSSLTRTHPSSLGVLLVPMTRYLLRVCICLPASIDRAGHVPRTEEFPAGWSVLASSTTHCSTQSMDCFPVLDAEQGRSVNRPTNRPFYRSITQHNSRHAASPVPSRGAL